jgi:hypothetical protein
MGLCVGGFARSPLNLSRDNNLTATHTKTFTRADHPGRRVPDGLLASPLLSLSLSPWHHRLYLARWNMKNRWSTPFSNVHRKPACRPVSQALLMMRKATSS